MLKKYLIALMFFPMAAMASDMDIQIELPTLNVAEYHNPYVAVWLQSSDKKITNLSVWYQLESKGGKWGKGGKSEGNEKNERSRRNEKGDKKGGEKGGEKGEDWLKDLRQWWRFSGRSSSMPIDGVSGATRRSGVYQLHFTQGQKPLENLPAGDYILMVEAAREVGGREVIKIPFSWPVKEKVEVMQKGKTELGEVKLVMNVN